MNTAATSDRDNLTTSANERTTTHDIMTSTELKDLENAAGTLERTESSVPGSGSLCSAGAKSR